MKKFLALLRVGFQSMLLGMSGSGRGGKRRKARTALGAAAIIALVGLYISGVYSYMLLEVLAPLGMEALLFVFMGLAALFSGVLLTTFAVKNTVYGGQDNDLLLSMPVSSTTLMLSRVAAIYAESLLLTFFMLVPAGVVCAFLSPVAGRDVGFWIRLLAAVVCLPLLDTTLSLLLGAGVAWLSTRVTKKAIGQNLVMGLYLAVVFWFSFNISGMIENLGAAAMGLRDAMGWARPLFWMADGILDSWGDILAFAALCAVPFAAAVFALGKLYRKAVTAFSAQAARDDYRLTRQQSAGQRRALLRKEAQRFFGTPIWFWNAVLGHVMLAAGSVLLLIRRDAVASLLPMIGERGWIGLILAGIAGFCLSTGMVAAPSISLEGKSLWILREAPVDEGTLIGVKTGFELLVSLPGILLATVCLVASGLFAAGEWLGFAAFALVFGIGHAAFGMLMGMTFPRLDAPSDAAVVKQSLLAFLSMFAPMAALGLAALAGWLISLAGAWTAPFCMLACVRAMAALFAVASVLMLRWRGTDMLRGLGEQG